MQYSNPSLEQLLPAVGAYLIHIKTNFSATASDILSAFAGLCSNDCLLAYNTHTHQDRAVDSNDITVLTVAETDGSISENDFILVIPSKYINIRFDSDNSSPYLTPFDGILKSIINQSVSIPVIDSVQGQHGSQDLLMYPSDYYLLLEE